MAGAYANRVLWHQAANDCYPTIEQTDASRPLAAVPFSV